MTRASHTTTDEIEANQLRYYSHINYKEYEKWLSKQILQWKRENVVDQDREGDAETNCWSRWD